jgi:hypothetical protein
MIRDPDRLAVRRLLRNLLKIEEGLKGYRPEPRPWSADPPPAPRGADEVLAALASLYRPGDAIGLQQVVDCIAIDWDRARAIRQWAESVGAWPYLRPGALRATARPRKGGVL